MSKQFPREETQIANRYINKKRSKKCMLFKPRCCFSPFKLTKIFLKDNTQCQWGYGETLFSAADENTDKQNSSDKQFANTRKWLKRLKKHEHPLTHQLWL